MKIPGLTFIFVPIFCWLLYIYSGNIINFYNIEPEKFIVIAICIYSLIVFIEILFFTSESSETDKEMFTSTKSLLPFILLYKFLVFINKHLTIKI